MVADSGSTPTDTPTVRRVQDAPRPAIIDTHVHFWQRRNPDPGMDWTWIADDAENPLLGDIDGIKMLSYTVENLWAEARFADVSAFVHVQAAIGSDDPVKETVWLTRMRQGSPVPFAIVGDASLGSPNGRSHLERHCESPYFVGIRDFTAEAMLRSGEVDRLYESNLDFMASRSLVFDLDCEWPQMAAAFELAKRHPDLSIVLDHIGFPRRRDDEYFSSWAAAMEMLAGAPNVTCKISGVGMTDWRFTAESLGRWLSVALDSFGPERCVLGSNWPVDRLYSSYDVIMGMYRDSLSGFGERDQARVLSENAARLYRL